MNSLGISLAVQWLRVCTPSTDSLGSIPGWETKALHIAWHGQKRKKLYMSSSKEYTKGDVKTKIPSLFVQTTWNLNLCSVDIFMFYASYGEITVLSSRAQRWGTWSSYASGGEGKLPETRRRGRESSKWKHPVLPGVEGIVGGVRGGTTTCESLELTLTAQSILLTAGERMGDTVGGGRESA